MTAERASLASLGEGRRRGLQGRERGVRDRNHLAAPPAGVRPRRDRQAMGPSGIAIARPHPPPRDEEARTRRRRSASDLGVQGRCPSSDLRGCRRRLGTTERLHAGTQCGSGRQRRESASPLAQRNGQHRVHDDGDHDDGDHDDDRDHDHDRDHDRDDDDHDRRGQEALSLRLVESAGRLTKIFNFRRCEPVLGIRRGRLLQAAMVDTFH